MSEKEFCIWLQGYFEIAGTKKLNEEQVGVIREKLYGVKSSIQGLAARYTNFPVYTSVLLTGFNNYYCTGIENVTKFPYFEVVGT